MSGFPSLRLTAFRVAPALLLASASSHALAETPAALGYSGSERVAATLLAGGMSRLSAISAQQGGTGPSWMPQPVVQQAIVNDRRLTTFMGKLPGWQLQGVKLAVAAPTLDYRAPELMPSFMRGLLPVPAAQASAFVMSARAALSLPSAPPRSGQPDVFGSVALPISRTALDGKWAAATRPIGGNALWSGLIHAAQGAGRQQQVEMVNRWVNQRLHFVDDRGDTWATASQSLVRGAGDCEDYAIAKMKLLEAAGFDRRAMFLVIARDLVRQADHAVLAVRIDDQLMILDNMTDRVLPSSAVGDYRPIMSFNAFGRWTHGYRVTPAKVQFAAR
ncbi:transglutaminase-like cysteine peptidase [Sphingobium bisphenolivorans]|uniref:transglutaminase-like cysteine peptidase n=1 Tax=Sphingobium bisphenolivorans TaxID=1335760 RepID=UPI00039D5DCD|nr:transglutaminase-like cysteine peptidase [Sphingobium bisphenolivorans]